MSNLHDWFDVIEKSGKQHREQEEEWRKKVGNPFATLELEGCKLGFWRAKGGVFTATIRKNGPDPHTVETFTEQFIEKLVSTLKG